MFLTWVVYSSLTASVVALIILLIKGIFKNALGARWHYSIWFLLLGRMVVPFGPETSFSVFNLYSYFTRMMINNNITNKYSGGTLAQQTSYDGGVSQLIKMPMDYSVAVNDTLQDSLYSEIFIIWLIGALVIAVSIILCNLNFYYRLRDKEYIIHGDIIDVVEDCRHRMAANKRFRIAQSDSFKSPILVGSLTPTLIFPKIILKSLERKELEYIILHELAHYKRKDILVNWITVILQILHWFNPIIWYAFYKMRQDREVACDAYVLSHLKPEEHKGYGLTIITMLENISFSLSVPQITGFSSQKSHIKNRISMIASFSEDIRSTKIKKLIVFTLLACIVLTNGRGMKNTALGMDSSDILGNALYEDLSGYFSGYEGSFVLFDMQENKYHIYNKQKSQERVSPCSTFKIITSLIGLENGILEDENTELKWDGAQHSFKTWNKDHTLASAMENSVNWYFQEINEEIGEKEMKEKMKAIDYGNNDISAGITKFWAQSSLKISPIEQVNILKKIYNYEMPFAKENINVVKEILKISKNEEAILSGKTGTGGTIYKSINGWFIGHISKGDNQYIFAVNIEGDDRADGTNARRIALSILKDKGLL